MLNAKVKDAESRATSVKTSIQEIGTNTVELHGLIEDLTQTVAEERAHLASLVNAKMLRFCTVLSSAWITGVVCITKEIDAVADKVPFSTSGTATDVLSSHARGVYLSLRLIVLVCCGARLTVWFIA